MNLHEYQGKNLLKSFGVTIQEGIVAENAKDAVAAYKKLQKDTGTEWAVVKAQIHAGGRGKGGGVKIAKNEKELKEIAGNIIGMMLKTPQTPGGVDGPGKLVSKVLIAEDVYAPDFDACKEYYVSILMDRERKQNVIIYSTEGGMDIEEVAENTPHLLHKEYIDPTLGLQGFQTRKVAFNLGLSGVAFKGMTKFIANLYKAFVQSDASMFEINPCLKTGDDRIIAVDCKVSLDENALFRHPDLAELRDTSEEDPTEVEAKAVGLNYVKLDGNVGCMVNGAGLAMGTMDLVKTHGGNPANFLEVGGGATKEAVTEAFKIILSDDAVQAVLINIFGGIVSCAIIAEGIIAAVRDVGVEVPVVVRFEGNNSKAGAEMLTASGLNLIAATSLTDAAQQAVKAAGGKA